MRLFIFFFFFGLFIFSCSSTKKTTAIVTYVYHIESISYWKNVSPIMFMDTLKKYPGAIFAIGVSPEKEWYDVKYISQLQKFDHNKQVSAAIISRALNMRPVYKKTTLAEQTKYLIKGIKEQSYPPTLSSIYGF